MRYKRRMVPELVMFTGPVALAVMGGAVAISPPDSRRARWLWGTAFGIIGIITVIGTVKVTLDSEAAQKELTDTVKGLKDSIDKLTQPVPKSDVPPQRDPDSIYQNGSATGRVIAPRITLNESKVYFEELQNAGNLDIKRPFEYRDFILKMERADAYIGMLVTPSGVATSVYQHVVCDIVGRVTTH
jgi:hypothetical protein